MLAPWLSVSEVRYLEEPVKELLDQLMVRSTPEQFHLLLLLLRDGLDTSKFRSGCHRVSVIFTASVTVQVVILLASVKLCYLSYKLLYLVS